MKKKKYLPLYFEWMKTGKIEEDIQAKVHGGLCSTVLLKDTSFRLFDGREYADHCYWGYEYKININRLDIAAYKFTPLRQNIVLFLAAMNNEL